MQMHNKRAQKRRYFERKKAANQLNRMSRAKQLYALIGEQREDRRTSERPFSRM